MLLNDEQWKFVEKEVKRKPTKKEVERLKDIRERFKNFPL